MQLTVRQRLTLPLASPARSVAHLLLTPSPTPQQKVEHWSIDMPGIEGAAAFRDGFGNRAQLVTQVKPQHEVSVIVSGRIETFDKSGVLGRLDYEPVPALFRRVTTTARPERALLDGLSTDAGRIGQLHDLMGRIYDVHTVQSQAQDGQEQSQGVEQPDAVELFIDAARSLGIPARYVRGYLFDDGRASIHSWAEAWDDGLGWIGFDPQLNVCPTTGHIRIACGLDAASATAIRIIPEPEGEVTETIEVDDQDPST